MSYAEREDYELAQIEQEPQEVAPLNDVRWQCRCGRFIAESAIREENYRDPDAYYGVSTKSSYTCPRCGEVDRLPRLTVVGELK